MKSKFQKIFNLLQGRVARNIYFWSIALIVDITTPSPLWLHIGGLIHNGLLITLVYFNNLVLIPRLITKRKFLAYFILVFVSIFLITFSETLSTKAIYHYHTYLHSPHPVIKISDNLSFSSVLQEMTSYFIEGVIYTFFFTLAWYMMNYSKQQRSIEAARKKQTEAELLFLKGQINPHFLFNTLNNLYGLSMEKSDSTPVAIHKLSSILRYLLYESNSAVVSFEMERDIMLSYIDLELLRLSNKDNLEFSITSDSVYNIPPLLWLPVLENVFKHGTRFINEDYLIDYRFSINDGKLVIYSKNKFKPHAQKNGVERSQGIGLSNLRSRLEILYPARYTIETKHEDEYYFAIVEIMLK